MFGYKHPFNVYLSDTPSCKSVSDFNWIKMNETQSLKNF